MRPRSLLPAVVLLVVLGGAAVPGGPRDPASVPAAVAALTALAQEPCRDAEGVTFLASPLAGEYRAYMQRAGRFLPRLARR